MTIPIESAPLSVTAAARLSLRPWQRIRKGADFQHVYAARKSVHTPVVTIAYCTNNLAFSRLGLSVGSKHGNAVQRNRIKRVFRAAFREARASLPSGFDYVLIPRKGVTEYSSASVKQALLNAVLKIR